MNRKPLIAANWKMHDAPQGWDDDNSPYEQRTDIEVVVFPGMLDVHRCIERELQTGAQYGRPEPDGPFTGDCSMKQLSARGCSYVLCGHSERRHHHAESNSYIAEQFAAALEAGLHPILCIGETADEREMNMQKQVVQSQLAAITTWPLPKSFSLAYEPVWAIGSGTPATAEDAETMHAYIRSLLPEDIQQDVHILYGGSVDEHNAAELMAMQNIDGFLVGGASLRPESFRAIVDSGR